MNITSPVPDSMPVLRIQSQERYRFGFSLVLPQTFEVEINKAFFSIEAATSQRFVELLESINRMIDGQVAIQKEWLALDEKQKLLEAEHDGLKRALTEVGFAAQEEKQQLEARLWQTTCDIEHVADKKAEVEESMTVIVYAQKAVKRKSPNC